ncbi:MAG: c-type cytochrome, partial [Cyclobacteriaceae bacterium]
MLACFVLYACGSSKQEKKVEETPTVAAPKTDPGKLVYTTYCRSCHQAGGEGSPGLYPPLTQSETVQGNKETLIRVILEGQKGLITVHGVEYNNEMAKMDYLTDKQISDVLTWLRSNFENNASSISEEEVKNVREKIAS